MKPGEYGEKDGPGGLGLPGPSNFEGASESKYSEEETGSLRLRVAHSARYG
jgi:hypothetical protein